MADLAQAVLWFVAGCVFLFWIYPFVVEPRTGSDEDQAISQTEGKVTKQRTLESGAVLTIRLTDDGELALRSELADITLAVRNFKGGPVLNLWYIHGWKHNAEEGDSDLANFKKLVSDLQGLQEQAPPETRRHVVGIYVGWDAAAGPWYLRDLTFWNRKRAADQISQSSIVTKIFARVKYARLQRAHPNDLTVLIGHSFGARILFSATSHVLIEEAEQQHPGESHWGYRRIKGPADLVLLLNPAFEASMFTALHAIRRDDDYLKISHHQQPLLLAISSVNDWATKLLYPLGQTFGLATRLRERTTLGNYGPYITHDLTASCESVRKSGFWYDHFQAGEVLLLHRMQRRGTISGEAAHWGNPFIVAQTTPEIINKHNGIWTPTLRSWILSFISAMEERSAQASVAETDRSKTSQQTVETLDSRSVHAPITPRSTVAGPNLT